MKFNGNICHKRILASTKPKKAFSLIEVLSALLILSISIVALSHNQTSAIRLIQASQLRDTATLLAQSKMVETDRIIQDRGLGEIKDSEAGEFDKERYPTFGWRVMKEKIPVPNFTNLVSMASGEQADDESYDTSAMQGPLKMITDIWGKAIKQVTVEVTWKERNDEKSYRLVTHYVEKDVFAQVQGLVGGLTGGGGSVDEEED